MPRREMLAAMHDCDVSISLGEGFLVGPHPTGDIAADIAIMAELGVRRINTLSREP